MSAHAIPAGRALHLVDLENVIGDPRASGPGVVETYEEVLVHGRHRAGDLVVVAVNPGMFRQIAFCPHTSCQLIVARGRDGADLALLGWARPEWIVARFDRLVVASGDGIFAPVVRTTREHGLVVEVLHGRGQVSGRLRRTDVPVVHVPVDGDDHDLAA